MAFSFGQTPASTPAFSFGTTPAFGGAGATPSLPKAASSPGPLFGATSAAPGFGAASAPSLFGASSSAAASPFSFSTSQPAQATPSLFGAQPASTPSLFGAQPASTPSLFGAQPASTPSLFGAQPASAPSLFGAQPAQSAPSLFGAQPAQSAHSLFGAQPASAPSLFGAAPAAAAAAPAAVAFAGAAPQAPDLSAIRELESIKDSYVPGPNNPRYRFQHLLLNVVDNPAARAKPAEVDGLQWREALHRAGGADNPDHLWPVLAQGFKDLLARKAAQDAAIKEHSERLEALSQMAAQLASRQETVLRDQLEAVRRRHAQLCHQLLRVLRHVDALEGRFAQAVGYRGAQPLEVVHNLLAQLGEIEAGLAPSAANGGGLQGKVKALAAAARLRAGAPPGGGAGRAADLSAAVDEAALEQLYAILSQYSEALGKLNNVLQRTERDVGILEYKAGGNGERPS